MLGLFFGRINSRGATWGLLVGFVLGMLKLTIQMFFGFDNGKVAEPAFLAAIGDFNFLYFSGVLFLISVLIIIFTSLMSAPPDPEKIRGLTYSSIDHQAVRASWDYREVLATIVILGLVATLYVYFSFWI